MNDERLARRAAAGDTAAFERIFRRYHQDLYRYCLATVGNPQDAQDALQNTMVKAMQALPGEQRQIKLKPWLYRVARNEAIEMLRKRREGVQLDAEREASSMDIADSTADRERLRQLFVDLEELPERQRSALVMRELAGLDFEEIGASFGTSPAVVRQTLYEARLSLRQMDEGREMRCETVMSALSDADGRVTRRRDLRAHLRGCASCRRFREEITERRGEFAAIAPLPLALSAGMLQAAAASGMGGAAASGAGAAGGLAGTIGAGVGKTVAGATIAKSAATVAVVAAVGVSAAERGGIVDLPLGDDGGGAAKPALERRSPAAGKGSAAPARQGGRGSGAEAGPGSGQGDAKRSASPQIGRPGAADKARRARARAGRKGRPARPAKSRGSQGARRRSGHQGGPGNGRGPVAGKRAARNPAPASSRGQENAAAPVGTASPPPKREQPTKSGGAKSVPSPPPVEAPEAEQGSSSAKGARGGKLEQSPLP